LFVSNPFPVRECANTNIKRMRVFESQSFVVLVYFASYHMY